MRLCKKRHLYKRDQRIIDAGESKLNKRQCTYNVTLRRVRVTLVAVEFR